MRHSPQDVMKACPPFSDLNAMIDADLPDAHELAVRRHLDLCAACRQRVDGLTALKRAVGRAYPSEAPSAALRLALAAALAERRRNWWRWVVAGPFVFATGAALFSLVRYPAPSAFAAALLTDHIQSLSEPDRLETTTDDPESLSAWFRNRLTYPVTLRDLPASRLVGGRQGTILGQRLAVASYDRGGERVSLFVAHASAVDAPLRSSFDTPRHRRCTDSGSYRVCMHRTGEQLIGIVAHRRARPEELLTATESF
jgi:anti-sigma factor RsiW